MPAPAPEIKIQDWFNPEDWFQFSYRNQEFLNTIADSEIQGKYALFALNITPHHQLPNFVGKLFWAGWETCQANIDSRKWLESEVEGWSQLQIAEQLQKIERKRNIILGWNRTPEQLDLTYGSTTDVLRQLPERLYVNIADMYPMQIVGAWAAFEILAGDLWIHAMNRKPGRLASLSGLSNAVTELARGKAVKFNRSQKNEDRDVPGKSVKVELIGQVTNQSFDLSNCMGTFLSEAKRVSFTTLSDIRKAYATAFATQEEFDNARPLLMAMADERLDVLSLLRNLLVHRAGNADEVCIKDSAKVASAPKIKLGHKLFLDGEITRTQVEASVLCAMSLVKGIDLWLSTTPKTKTSKT